VGGARDFAGRRREKTLLGLNILELGGGGSRLEIFIVTDLHLTQSGGFVRSCEIQVISISYIVLRIHL
jgi:hypothetical protein